MPRRRFLILSVLLFFTVLLIIHLHTTARQSHLPRSVNGLTPANSTLGFGTIIAVSHARSPRTPSLLWAANLTDLDIVIPVQEQWTKNDLDNLRASKDSTLTTGSARAWLGHLAALRHFLSTTHSTALILEDDTDFSLSIRHSQIPLLAAAVRVLLANDTALPSVHDPNYWAPPSTWDLLYPGHCDDLLAPSKYLAHAYIGYRDATTPPHALLHPDTTNFLHSLNVPAQTRFLHRAFWPFCTFAYAVTRASASLILETHNRERDGGTSAFDVALLEACRDRGWRCWSVSPELFHHGVGESEIWRADVDVNVSANGTDEGGRIRAGRGAWNIRCGARHAQLWVDEGNGEARREMKRLVVGMVERGECAVDRVEEQRGCKGCEWGECGAQS